MNIGRRLKNSSTSNRSKVESSSVSITKPSTTDRSSFSVSSSVVRMLVVSVAWINSGAMSKNHACSDPMFGKYRASASDIVSVGNTNCAMVRVLLRLPNA